MQDINALLETISTIYSVPGSTERWSKAIGEVADLVGAKAASHLVINAENHEVEVGNYSGWTEEAARRYEGKGGMSRDIRFKYIDNLIAGKVFREFEYVPDRAAYEANEWIQYQLKSLGLFWCLTAKISTHGLWHDYISVNRLHDLGPHTDDEKATLQALLPHLSRAAELHRTISRLDARYGAVLAVLDKLLVGLVILDLKGRVAIANAAARAACEASGALRLEPNGRLRARDSRKETELQALITRTSMTVAARDHSDGGSLMIDSHRHTTRLLLEIMPIRDDGFPDSDNLRGTAVFILDPASPYEMSVDGISKIFGLTPSEHAVASSLVNGAEVREIAEERSNSIATVRSHLKSIFSKTGATSQLELLRLVVKANPPIAGS